MTRMTAAEFRKRVAKKKRPRKNARPEAALKASILERLTARGYWCWVNNSGSVKATYKGRDRLIRMSPKGSPDIFVIIKPGRLCGIECKAPGGKQSDGQKEWEKLAKSQGVRYAVVYDVETALEWVNTWHAEVFREVLK